MPEAVYYLNEGGIDLSNVRAQFKVTALEDDPTDTNGVAMRFRRSDEDNWWEFGMHDLDNTYVVRKKVAGDIYFVAQPGTSRAAGDILRVEAYEERVNCYVNETLIASVADTELMDNPTVGFRFSAGAVDTAIDGFYALGLEEDIRVYVADYIPDYQVLVDWDKDGGLTFGDFESERTLDGWEGGFGSRPVTMEITDEFSRSGYHSLKCTWTNFNLFQFDVDGHGFDQGQLAGPGYENIAPPFKFAQAGQGFDDGRFATNHDEASPEFVAPHIRKTKDKLVVGRTYTLRAWVWVPESNTAVSLRVEGIDPPAVSTLFNQWEELVVPYTATATSHEVLLGPVEENPDTGDYFYFDEAMNLFGNEDITCYVLGLTTPLNFRSGRDQARSLASISPAEVEMSCDNTTQIFSPDNPGSPLYGFLAPGRSMMIRATHNNQVRSLFHGFVDNYTLQPNPEERYVDFSCMDALQYLSNANMSTELYPSIQTGQAIHLLLDQIDWPEEKRDIDSGATTIKWWHEEETDGLSAVQKVVQSEGLPAIAYVDTFGNFVFRDRHHRLLDNRSVGIQTNIQCDPDFDEPVFSAPLEFDIGWKDIINQIEVEVENRVLRDLSEVWTQEDLIVIPAGTLKTIEVKANSPFYNMKIPTTGFEDVQDFDADIGKDITLKTGSGAIDTINLSRTSGASTKLELKAGASAVTISKIRLRAQPMGTDDPQKVTKEDSDSIETYGKQTATEEFPWTGLNDMNAIAEVLLGHRSERLPVVNIDINNGHAIRISNILNRQLSDRIHIREMLQTFMDEDYFIEVIEHKLEGNGKKHTMTLRCEKAREQKVIEEDENPLPVFTFDDAAQGFNDGYFLEGGSGLSLSDNLFILDSSLLGEDGLGF